MYIYTDAVAVEVLLVHAQLHYELDDVEDAES